MGTSGQSGVRRAGRPGSGHARRVEEARARIVAGDVDEANLLSYEELVGRIDELRRR
jgi:hypothetical protein